MNAKKPLLELELAAGLPRDGHDAEWLHLMDKILRLPGCYLPAVQVVLGQPGWRRLRGPGQNPLGYIKTAAIREAMKMGLAQDRYSQEPRVPTKDQPPTMEPRSREEELRYDAVVYGRGRSPLDIPVDANYQDALDGMLEAGITDSGDEGYHGRVPDWLCRKGAPDSIDWETVARHAVRKPAMAARVARALQNRATGISRPRATANAANRKEAQEIEDAWKWVDRSWEDRIVPLFRMKSAPSNDLRSRPKRQIKPSATAFISPSDSLRSVLSRQAPTEALLNTGPSLQVPARKSPIQIATSSGFVTTGEMVEIGALDLVPDAIIQWDDTRGRMVIARRGSLKAYEIMAPSLREAAWMLLEAKAEGDAPDLFRSTAGFR